MTIANPDKGLIDEITVADRLLQFIDHADVVLTTASRFIDKCRLFPGVWFAMGFDTAERLVNPKYYDRPVEEILGAIASTGSKILVAGRNDAQHVFRQLSDLMIPTSLTALFIPIPPTEVCIAISSTELRAARVNP